MCHSVPATAEFAKTTVATTKNSETTKIHHLDASVDEYNLFTLTLSSNQPLMGQILQDVLNCPLEITGTEEILKGKQLYMYKPLWVLMVVNFLDSAS